MTRGNFHILWIPVFVLQVAPVDVHGGHVKALSSLLKGIVSLSLSASYHTLFPFFYMLTRVKPPQVLLLGQAVRGLHKMSSSLRWLLG